MSQVETKQIALNVKDLSFKSEQHVIDLLRYLNEALPQISINRDGFDVEIITPQKLSKKVIKLRIKRFLHKKELNNDFRPISFKDANKNGYIIKEKKLPKITYY
jgi:hypothetical protein